MFRLILVAIMLLPTVSRADDQETLEKLEKEIAELTWQSKLLQKRVEFLQAYRDAILRYHRHHAIVERKEFDPVKVDNLVQNLKKDGLLKSRTR